MTTLSSSYIKTLVAIFVIGGMICAGCIDIDATVIEDIDTWHDVHSIQLHYTGVDEYSIHYIDGNELRMLRIRTDMRLLDDPRTAFTMHPILHRSIIYHTEEDAKMHIVRRISHPSRGAWYYELEIYIPDKTSIDVGDDTYTRGRSTHVATGRTIYTQGE